MIQTQPKKFALDAKVMNIALKDLERENMLPPGYLTELRMSGSDWDFIVKIGLVLEAIVARAVALEMGRPLTYKRLNNETHHDRLILAYRKGLVDEVELRLLKTIAELRNAFVHRLENLTRSLREYFVDLSASRQKQIARSILAAGIPGKLGKSKDIQAMRDFPEDFRIIVLSAVFPTLLSLGYGHQQKQREKQYVEWRLKQERRYGSPLPPRVEGYLADRLMVMELLSKPVELQQPDSNNA